MNRHHPDRIESLEARIAPANLFVSSDHKRATWTDVDGDLVTLTATKAVLHEGDFTFLPPGPGDLGFQLAMLDLTNDFANGTSLAFTARRDPVAKAGDGFVNIGWLNVASDLGMVRVDGDLARLTVGDDNGHTPGLAGVIVSSAAALGTATQGDMIGGGPATVDWLVRGRLGMLTVKGDFYAALDVLGPDANPSLGSTGAITISGSLIGGAGATVKTDAGTGYLSSRGAMGAVKILGDLRGGPATQSGSIIGAQVASVRVGGNVIGGSGEFSGTIFSSGPLGSVFVGGSLFGGNTRDENGMTVNPYAAGAIGSGTLVSKVTILGSAVGGGSFFGGGVFTVPDSGGKIGSVSISGMVSGGSELGSVGGNQVVVFQGIYSDSTIGAVKVGGLYGKNPGSPVRITARGVANPASAAQALAIGSVTVTGGTNGAEILAGYGPGLTELNPDVQIGSVKIGTAFVASSIAVGVSRGTDFFFGNEPETVIAAADPVRDDPAIVARLGSVTIGGYVYGHPSAMDSFAIQAEQIGAVKIGLTVLPMAPNTGFTASDDFLLGVTHDFRVREV